MIASFAIVSVAVPYFVQLEVVCVHLHSDQIKLYLGLGFGFVGKQSFFLEVNKLISCPFTGIPSCKDIILQH